MPYPSSVSPDTTCTATCPVPPASRAAPTPPRGPAVATSSPIASGDLARRSAGAPAPTRRGLLGPSAETGCMSQPFPPDVRTLPHRAFQESTPDDDRDEVDGHRGRGAGRHQPDRAGRRQGASVAG